MDELKSINIEKIKMYRNIMLRVDHTHGKLSMSDIKVTYLKV